MNVSNEVGTIPRVGAAARPLEPIAGYDTLDAAEVASKLKTLSQGRLKRVRAYEKAHQARTSVLHKIGRLIADQPWRDYDTQQVNEIITVLAKADADTARQVLDFEREHKDRARVIAAAARRRHS